MVFLAAFAIIIVGFIAPCNNDPLIANNVERPNWRGITPELTTEDKVKQILGDPDLVGIINLDGSPDFGQLLKEFKVCLCGQRFYLYQPLGITVYFRSGQVWAWRLGFSALPEKMNISDLIDLYGKPDLVTWSSRISTDNIVIFADKGVLARVHGTPHRENATVIEMIFFSPMPLDRVTEEFWREMSLTEAPVFPTQDLSPTIKDPWGFNE